MPLDEKTRVVRSPDLMSTPVDEEIVILSLAANHYVGLDHLGRRVWDLLETPQRVDELARLLSAEFCATPQTISDDLLGFLTQLESEGLVHVAG